MDIQAERNWIHQEIDKVKDTAFLEKLKTLLKSRNESVQSVDEYNHDLENALDNIAKGNFVSEEEAKIISEKWNRK